MKNAKAKYTNTDIRKHTLTEFYYARFAKQDVKKQLICV